ncbi:N-6 DNA methylase [Companilactobacillus nodensis]|nr:N-6 DNA methylase [Companilactobacillus nodensis]
MGKYITGHDESEISRNTKVKRNYLIMMVLFVTHDDRKETIRLLKSHPDELASLFKNKAKENHLEFSDNIPRAINLGMVREICDEFAKQDSNEDVQAILNLFISSDNDSLIDLIMDIADIQDDETVLDVEFNHGDLLLRILDENINQSVTGYDETILYDFVLLITYFRQASHVNLNHRRISSEVEEKFDWVISKLPDPIQDKSFWKMILADELNSINRPIPRNALMNCYEYIESSMNKTHSDGRVIFIFHEFDLQRDSPLKKEIVENDWIRAIIQLGRSFPNSGMVIVVLDKAKKKNQQRVRMIDASDMVWKNKNNSEITAMKKRIVDTLGKDNSYADFVRTVDTDEISNSGYDLMPEAYLKDRVYELSNGFDVKVHRSEFDNIKTIELGKIADILDNHVPTLYGNIKSKYRVVLVNNDGDFVLSDYEWRDVPEYYSITNEPVQKSDILVTRFTDKKISYVTKNYVDLLFIGIVVRLKNPNFNSRWLAQYLRTPLAKAEFKRVKNPNFSISKVRVPVIPLESQIEGISSYNQNMEVISDTRQRITENMNNAKLELYREMGLNRFFK